MSPEQQQEPVADVRNDIYSLGVIFGQMNLGQAYKGVVRKCLLTANRRYQSMAEMRSDLARRQRRPMAMTLAAAAVAMAALLGVIAFMANQMHRQQDVMAQQEQQLSQQALRMKSQQQRVSSLEKETATARQMQETQSKTMANMNDSLTRLTETNQKMREKQAAEVLLSIFLHF